MGKGSEQIDFNNPESLNQVANEIASKHTGKKTNLNIKLIAIITGYFAISGIAVNIFLIIKLIIKLF